MPYLTLPVTSGGLYIDLSIGVSKPREDALKKASQVIPARIPVRALIDTGASCTVVDISVLHALGLTPKGSALMHTGSTVGVAHSCNVYDISLIVPHPTQSLSVPAVSVAEINLSGQGQSFRALLGMDILSSCILFYDGRAKQFTFGF
jgi:hypothetical protein